VGPVYGLLQKLFLDISVPILCLSVLWPKLPLNFDRTEYLPGAIADADALMAYSDAAMTSHVACDVSVK